MRCPAGFHRGVWGADTRTLGLTRRGVGSCLIWIDECGSVFQVAGIQQTLNWDIDKVGVAEITITVGVHQTAGLRKQIPALHRLRSMGGNVGVFENAKAL